MGKAEAGSLKAISNAMKAKGLTKLRFYCQVCQKACRDQNGYKCHIESEAHMRQIDALTSSGDSKKIIDDFSATFQREFVQLLSRRYGTRRIKANQVYQEHIADRHHLHMNATKWTSLSEFVKHLGREGVVQVEDTEQGWYITWVDNSPAALARQDALQKLERAKMDDEQRQRKLLQEQMDRSQAQSQAQSQSASSSEPAELSNDTCNKNAVEQGLVRGSSAPVRIGFSLGSLSKTPTTSTMAQHKQDAGSSNRASNIVSASPIPPSSSSSLSSSSSSSAAAIAPAFKMGFNVLKSNSTSVKSLRSSSETGRANPLKAKDARDGDAQKPKPNSGMTMAEKIMQEELRQKKRKHEGASRASGPGPQMHSGIKRTRF
ncbi:hypothetical protein BCV70DRAFT_199359 [Testicularia cyperi]|uniref:C2H2-type domain-containing protein n=1 Tax=Testicularia cyperi TaxID=1882483 RepID=A0A317XRW8_9BASI|nr:hypothetical protein BCV70DRAFT_199359 [Testicularia cyperi]